MYREISHCHHRANFRKAYETIGDLTAYFRVPFLLTTATVNMDILSSMLSIFHMQRQDVNIVCRLPDR